MPLGPQVASWVAVVGSAGALLLAVWIAVRTSGVKGLPGCGARSGCAAVTTGRWSRLGMIPVAPLGAVLYAALLFGSLVRALADGWHGRAWEMATAVVALVAVGGAAWFTGLQLLVIRRLCLYCMAAHLSACASAGLLLVGLAPWAGPTWPTAAIVAAAAVVALAAGQTAIVPQRHAVVAAGGEAGKTVAGAERTPLPNPAPAPPAPRPANAALQRQCRLLGGSVVLNVDGWPLLGRPDARHVVAALFDLTCAECHHLHRLLAAAVEARPDWLAVALVPVPMHPACNPAVTCTRDAAAQACDYARLAWAVWLAGGDRYADWDRYVTAEATGQPYGLALLRARELVNLTRFRPREPDPFLDRAVATGVGLYRAAGRPKVPAVLLPAGLLQGHVSDLAALMRILDAHLPSPSELAPS